MRTSKFCGYRHEALGPPPPPPLRVQLWKKKKTIQGGGEAIKEVIKCHFQSCFNSCKYAQNTPDQV